jgi:glycosyl transferase family 25
MSNLNGCLKYIDAILYINLEHRPDRKEHILREIRKIDPLVSKTHRIHAIHDLRNGALGCTQSHIKALELFIENKEWNTCLILEDDFTFISKFIHEINNSIAYLINNSPNFDVILLSTSIHGLLTTPTGDPVIKKVIESQTASGYIVSRKYANILIENFRESSGLMIKNGKKHEFCLDQYWKRLMPNDNWYTYKDRIGYQYTSYSDIEKKIVKYNC